MTGIEKLVPKEHVELTNEWGNTHSPQKLVVGSNDKLKV